MEVAYGYKIDPNDWTLVCTGIRLFVRERKMPLQEEEQKEQARRRARAKLIYIRKNSGMARS